MACPLTAPLLCPLALPGAAPLASPRTCPLVCPLTSGGGSCGHGSGALLRRRVGRGLRKPHPFRETTETPLEVADAPDDLRPPVPFRSKRQDRVAVCLGDRGAVAGKPFRAFRVGVDDRPVDIRFGAFHPRQKRRPHVEAHPRVVLPDRDYFAVLSENPGRGVRRIAFGRDAFVPVVPRRGGILRFDSIEPWVFPGRLIEMPVNADAGFHECFSSPPSLPTGRNTTAASGGSVSDTECPRP